MPVIKWSKPVDGLPREWSKPLDGSKPPSRSPHVPTFTPTPFRTTVFSDTQIPGGWSKPGERPYKIKQDKGWVDVHDVQTWVEFGDGSGYSDAMPSSDANRGRHAAGNGSLGSPGGGSRGSGGGTAVSGIGRWCRVARQDRPPCARMHA